MKAKVILAWVAVFCVFFAILWAIHGVIGDLTNQPIKLSEIQFLWCFPAGILFFLGMVPSHIFWHQILVRFGVQSDWKSSFAAFFISQLGKYVPGKVMVLGIRMAILGKRSIHLQAAELTPPPPPEDSQPLSNFEKDVLHEAEEEIQAPADQEERRVRRQKLSLIAAASFMETIMFMAVGTVIGCGIGVYYLWDQLWLAAGCSLLAVALVLPTLPPVFRFLAKIQPIRKLDGTLQRAVIGWDWKAVLLAWAILPIGWLSIGSSLFLLIAALPDETVLVTDLPRCVCGASISSVLGFLSLFPGGFGIRELVLFPILNQRFQHALVLAVLFRLTSLLGELIAAGISQVLILLEAKK